jgi:hypothetical protein
MPAERYGFSEDEWESLRELLRRILVERVRSDLNLRATNC